MRKARYDDLIEKYENPIEHACAFHKADFTYHKNKFVGATSVSPAGVQ